MGNIFLEQANTYSRLRWTNIYIYIHAYRRPPCYPIGLILELLFLGASLCHYYMTMRQSWSLIKISFEFFCSFEFLFQECCFATHSGSWFSFFCHTSSRLLKKCFESDLSQMSVSHASWPSTSVFSPPQLFISRFCTSAVSPGWNRGPAAAWKDFYAVFKLYRWGCSKPIWI